MSDSGPEATIYFVANGTAAGDEELRQMVHRLREQDYEIAVRPTWEAGDGQRIVAEAIDADADAVVACGGDGTLHEVVNELMSVGPASRPMMAGLAYGTGNDFLGAIGADPKAGPAVFEQWLQRRPQSIDVGKMNDDYFLNMATAGVGAQVTAATSDKLKDRVGSVAYFVKALGAAFDLETYAVDLTSEDWDWTGEAAFLFVGNGRRAGGGWQFCPAAKVDDGLLDVVVVAAVALPTMASSLREMVQAEAPGDYGPVIYRQVSSLNVEFEGSVPLNLDGEPCQERSLEFSICPKALRFLMP